MKSIILIGGEKDREVRMVKNECAEIEFPVIPSRESPLTTRDVPVNVEYDMLTYRATDIYFGASQVFLLDGYSQHDFIMRSVSHYICSGEA